ncbi:MAG: hypothetical protein HYR85_09355 [Planctomycetes bacterium]|nr:hypothetical protein [Planctomycetota bacterium]
MWVVAGLLGTQPPDGTEPTLPLHEIGSVDVQAELEIGWRIVSVSGNETDLHSFEFDRERGSLRFEPADPRGSWRTGIEPDYGHRDGFGISTHNVDILHFVGGVPVKLDEKTKGVHGDLAGPIAGFDTRFDAGIAGVCDLARLRPRARHRISHGADEHSGHLDQFHIRGRAWHLRVRKASLAARAGVDRIAGRQETKERRARARAICLH